MTVIARRLVMPTPCARGVPSWKRLSGRWQVAQATLLFELKRVSKKSFCPNAAASRLSAYWLDGSAERGGRLPIHKFFNVTDSSSPQRVGRREEQAAMSSDNPLNSKKRARYRLDLT